MPGTTCGEGDRERRQWARCRREESRKTGTDVVRADADNVVFAVVLSRVEGERRLSRSDRHRRLGRLELPRKDVARRSVEVDGDPPLGRRRHELRRVHARLLRHWNSGKACRTAERSVERNGCVRHAGHHQHLRGEQEKRCAWELACAQERKTSACRLTGALIGKKRTHDSSHVQADVGSLVLVLLVVTVLELLGPQKLLTLILLSCERRRTISGRQRLRRRRARGWRSREVAARGVPC